MPTVDVVIFTHDHEAFIGAAIDSVFSQVTSADIKLRVLDDASTDSTAEVVRKKLTEAPFPASLKVLETNQYQFGSSFKWDFARKSNADYIAFLDGDDYWVSPTKLQNQLDLMERETGAALCHTEFQGLRSNGQVIPFRPLEKFCQPIVAGSMLVEGNFIGTSTVVARRAMMPEHMPAGFNAIRGVDDYPLWALLADNRQIAFLDQCTTIYRLHQANNFANQPEAAKNKQLLLALVYISASVSPDNRLPWLNSIEKFLSDRSLVLKPKFRIRNFFRHRLKRLVRFLGLSRLLPHR